MSRASPVNMSSNPEEIYRHYSELYDKRDRQMRRYGAEMYARKLDKQSLMIVVQSQINDNKTRRWSMDQIVRNTVSRETSSVSIGTARGLIRDIQSGKIEAPEEWYGDDGEIKIPNFTEVRALGQTQQLNFAWEQIGESYHEFKAEAERLRAEGKIQEGVTASQYAKRIISQYYFGSP